jgi:hypothetical protein
MIRIESKEIITVNIIESIEILSGKISMSDRYASFPVRLYNQYGELLTIEVIEIIGEEYDAWTDDEYIASLVMSRLGMVRFVEPTPEPIVPEPEPAPTISGTSSENI